MSDETELLSLAVSTCHDSQCLKLIQDLHDNGNAYQVFAYQATEPQLKVLDTVDKVKKHCYKNGNFAATNLLPILEKLQIIKISKPKFEYVEYFGNYEIYLTINSVDNGKMLNLIKLYASQKFTNKYGDRKQTKVLENLIKKEYSKLENSIITFIHNPSDWSDDYNFDPLIGINELTRLGYISHIVNKIDLRTKAVFDEPGGPGYDTIRSYELEATIHILDKLIHKWRVEDGLFSNQIRFDQDNGIVWLGDINYQLVRKQKDPSNVGLMWKILIDNANTYVPYSKIAQAVYGWKDVELQTKYSPGKKDKVRRNLNDIRKQIEATIQTNELADILSIEANGGFRLNFCPQYD